MTNEQKIDYPRGRELFDAIRKRPPLHLGTRSLTALSHFMNGYDHALFTLSISSEARLSPPREFHDWTAYRLHFKESTRGWPRMILERTEDESRALDRFYELFDEFENRKPRVVAKLARYKQQYFEESGGTRIARSYPSPILFVVYTDDPGFFITAEGPREDFPGRGFCPSLDGLRRHFEMDQGDLEILDQTTFARFKIETQKREELNATIRREGTTHP